MKNVVKCYEDFFSYFNALKTHCDLIKFVFLDYTPDASGVHDVTEEYARTLEKTKDFAPICVQEMFSAKTFALPDESSIGTNIEGLFMLLYQNM